MIYVDTSVLVAYYSPEPLSQPVQNRLSQEEPALSDLTEVELVSTIYRKVRMEEMEKVDANRIIAKFQSHLDKALFTRISVQPHHWQLARGWLGLFTTPLKTLDAVHLSIASAENLELVTADKHLYQSADFLGVKASLVGE